MKIAFFGTPGFTTEFLEVLKQNNMTPALVVTNPDRPQGRGMTLTSPAPKVWADSHGVAVLQPEKITEDFYDSLGTGWDLFVVIAYGKILPEKLISIPRLGTINVHYSLLPKYRGATPVESAILHGDTETGVSIQHMVFELDAGPVIAEATVAIEPHDTTPTLRHKLNKAALILLPEVINHLGNSSATFTEQNHAEATSTKKISKEHGKLDLTDDHMTNYNKYRAYAGSIGTYFMAQKDGKGIRMKIKNAHFADGQFLIDEIIPENGKPIKFFPGL